ncbi:WSC-domain-containing protein [Meredithblackwellia eburnea MCA 4105]
MTLRELYKANFGHFHRPCNAPVIVERADPIVSPGKISGHVHTISGASNIALNSTFETMRASDCTSCKVKQDLSAYWTPQLYFQWANGSFTSVTQVGGGLIYYLPRFSSSDTTGVLAFPDGLRILTGNPFKRSYDNSLMSQAIGWNCLGQAADPTRNPFLPPNDCPNGLRAEIRFPSCWDGVNTDSSDHFSHMAYSDGESGPCPSSHPKRIVTLFYEMMWSVHDFASVRDQGLNTTQPFVLAMGDPTGYGLHADFLDGWDKQVLQTAIDTCTSDSGVIEYCTVFDLYPDGDSCAKTPDVDEIVLGTLDVLPGCNPVVAGPAAATPCTASTTPEIFTHPVAYTGGAPPPGSQVLANQPSVVESYKNWKYQDCYSDAASVRALPNGLSTSPQTIETCLDACAAKGYLMCGIEYHGECWGGNTLNSASVPIGYGFCSMTCNGNSTQYCGGSKAFDLYTQTAAVSSSSILASTSSSLIVSSTKASSASSSSTASTTSTTSKASLTTASSAPPAYTVPAGKVMTNSRWTYSGCFSDLVNGGRSLPNSMTGNQTVDGCLSACDTAGYAICGLSYYGECYGASALSKASAALDSSKCTYACNNNAAETCGGSSALDVYKSTIVAALTTPATSDLTNVDGWSFSGCWSDLTTANRVRSLSQGLSNPSGTIEGCLASCTAWGATTCGLSYYRECYGSKTGLVSTSTELAATSCQFACGGNPNEWCGGNAALSVYLPSSSKMMARDHPSRLSASEWEQQ